MKKIAFYIDSMEMGGANRVIANLVEHFSKSYEVILINDIVPRINEKEYKVSSKVERFFLDENKKYTNVIEKEINRMISLRKLLKKENIDTVVSFMGPPNYRMLVGTLGMKIKKVVSVRNDPYREYGSGLKKVLAKQIFKLSDGCVFQTAEAKKYFPKSIQRKSKIIFNPVNEKFFNVNWDECKKDIIVVGRLQEQKNPLLALEAFIRIADEFTDYRLVYYGDGDLKDKIVKRSKDANLENRVIVYGKVLDVENKLANSSIYILSSDYEGLPNALMEAMAVGIPCITTDCPCGGPRNLVKNGKQGILVPCRDVKALSNAIRKILLDSALKRKISFEEKKRARDFFPSNIYKQWEDYLSKNL